MRKQWLLQLVPVPHSEGSLLLWCGVVGVAVVGVAVVWCGVVGVVVVWWV